MAALNLPLESIERAYLVYLQANLPQALDDVEAFWEGEEDPLVLPDIAQWYQGNLTPDSLFTIIQKLPAVTVEAINLAPTGELGIALVENLIVTVYTLSTSSPQLANKLSHRYGAAIAQVLIADKPQGVGIKEVRPPTMDVTETIDAPDNRRLRSFLKAAKISVPLRVTAVL